MGHSGDVETRSSRRKRFVLRMRRFRRQWESHGSLVRWGGVLFVMAVIVVAVGSWQWLIQPTLDEPTSADAVVVFAGEQSSRLETAIELLDRGVATALVLPNGNAPGWDVANAMCAQPQSFDVYCFTPGTDDSWGEARGIGRLADDNGWTELVAVTSTYHASRARVLLGRCTEAEVAVVADRPELSVVGWVSRLGREWNALIAAQTYKRSC